MDKLYELITEISKHPELYLGKPSVERLFAFICGFLYQNEGANGHCLDGFTQYVADFYRLKTSHNWASIIQFFSNTEEEAFDTFVKLFTDYTGRDR